jgi:hypothetical protein
MKGMVEQMLFYMLLLQVEYWGAWKTAARADLIKELVSDGRE